MAEFELQNPSLSDSVLQQPDRWSASVDVANNSNQDQEVWVVFYLNGEKAVSWGATVPAGGTETFENGLAWTTTAEDFGTGEFTVTAELSGTNYSVECGTMDVLERFSWDKVSVQSCSISRGQVASGQSVDFSATVRNDNDMPVVAEVQFQAGGENFGTPEKTIDAHATATLSNTDIPHQRFNRRIGNGTYDVSVDLVDVDEQRVSSAPATDPHEVRGEPEPVTPW